MCDELIHAFLTYFMTGTGDIVKKKNDYCPILVGRKTTWN